MKHKIKKLDISLDSIFKLATFKIGVVHTTAWSVHIKVAISLF